MIELYCVIKTEFQDEREKVKEYFSFGNRNHIKEIYYNGIKNNYDFIIIDDFKFVFLILFYFTFKFPIFAFNLI